MSDEIIDALKIRIEKAKRELPLDTINAINAVDWKSAILGLRNKGYTFEQLGDLELETELVLAGLLAPENYQREIETRMRISRSQANDLANDMNNLVFKKIREELIRNTERKKVFAEKKPELEEEQIGTDVLNKAGIEIIPQTMSQPELTAPEPHPLLAHKLSSPFKAEVVKTEHTLENITKVVPEAKTPVPQSTAKSVDPYREIPE
jgi:hypothetical protein